MSKKILAIILSFALVLVLTMVPLTSYWVYLGEVEASKENQNNNNNGNNNSNVLKVESITAELNEGIVYYANKKASPKKTDFKVVATMSDNSTADVKIEDVSLSVPSDFALNGGKVTLTYKTKTVDVEITLRAVELSSIEIAESPNRIKYQVGETFNKEGMVVVAKFNDGSSQSVSNYTLNLQRALVESDKKIIIYYTDGIITKSVDFPIDVSTELNDGNVVEMISQKSYINDGQNFSEATVTITAKYESGNKKILSSDEYDLSFPTGKAKLGVAYKAKATLKTNENISVEIPLITRNKLEAENAVIVGGQVRTENGKTFAGGFSAEKHEEDSVTFTLNMATNYSCDIVFSCASGFLMNDGETAMMKPLQMNTIMDVYVNNELIVLSDDVILSGTDKVPSSEWASLYSIFSEFTIKDVDLVSGQNTIKIKLHSSTANELNSWGESPSINLDWIVVETEGKALNDSDITSIKVVSDTLTVKAGSEFDSYDFGVIAEYSGGEKTVLSPDKYTITGASGSVQIGETYNLTATLKSNVSLTTSFTAKGLLQLEAENAVIVGGKATTENGKTFAGGFSSTNKPENSITFNVVTDKALNTALTINGANGCLKDENNQSYMEEVQFNTIVDVYVNGNLITIPDTLKIEATDKVPASSWASLYTIFKDITIGSIPLTSGSNTVVIKFKVSTINQKNKWNESPVMNIDYIVLK